jgi:hypothetical protein
MFVLVRDTVDRNEKDYFSWPVAMAILLCIKSKGTIYRNFE